MISVMKKTKVLVAQSCPSLCDPMDCSPPGSSVYGNSPGKNTGVSCHALLQGVFPTQGLNPGLLHCRHSLPSEPPGSQCCHNRVAQTGWLNNKFIVTVLEIGSQIKVSARLVSSEAIFLGLQLAIFSIFLHVVLPLYACIQISSCWIKVHLNDSILTKLPLQISYLKYSHILKIRMSVYE